MSKELKKHMRAMLDLMEADVTQGPWTGPGVGPQQGTGNMYNMTTGKKITGPMDMSRAKKLELSDVFGGNEYSIIKNLGYKWVEKPGYFRDIKSSIPRGELARVERAIGRKLEIIEMDEILSPAGYTRHDMDYFPQGDAFFERFPEETIIIEVTSELDWSEEVNVGDMFLANRTGATKYYRIWMRIV